MSNDKKTYTEVVQEFDQRLSSLRSEMKGEYMGLTSDVKDLADDIKDIKKAITGDDYGNKGIDDRVRDNEKVSSENKDRLDKIWHYSIAAGAVMAFVFELLTRLT